MTNMNSDRDRDVNNAASSSASSDTLREFFNRYMQPSFGSLPKKEIDLLVYRLMRDVGYINAAALDFQAISRELRISPARAKSLYFEAQLRSERNKPLSSPNDQREWLRENLSPVLSKIQIQQRQGGEQPRFEVRLLIRDPLVRNELEGYLLNMQQFADYSFNLNILVLDFSVFSELIESLVDDETLSRVETDMASLVKASKQDIWKEVMQAFVTGAASSAGKQLFEVGFNLLIPGGVQSWIKMATNVISAAKSNE